MFNLLNGNDKKNKKDNSQNENIKEAKELFNMGRFPVVTTQLIENRPIAKVLGLVCCRGFDSEEAFFGMAAMAVKKGAQGIIGYNENIAFHPDGSKYFSCFGTAVMFEREGRNDLLSDPARIKSTLSKIPTADVASLARQAQYTQNTQQDIYAQNMQQVPFMQNAQHTQMAQNQYATQQSAMSYTPSSFAEIRGLDEENTFDKEQVLSSAQIAAQMVEEEKEVKLATPRPSEEEDPVLQRILAVQKRQAVPNMQ